MKTRNEYRAHRHRRVRSRVAGTATAPRLAIFKSLRNISAQVIDDVSGKTLVAASNHDVKKKTNATVDIARQVGKLIAERAKAAKITKIVFDRGGNVYHGQVKALAEGAREGGLEF